MNNLKSGNGLGFGMSEIDDGRINLNGSIWDFRLLPLAAVPTAYSKLENISAYK
jgi:hypothetical protein